MDALNNKIDSETVLVDPFPDNSVYGLFKFLRPTSTEIMGYILERRPPYDEDVRF